MFAKNCNSLGSIRIEPCFSRTIHNTSGCIHLPVAWACNMQCCYCPRRFDRAEEPTGTAGNVLTPDDALHRVRSLKKSGENPDGIVISGPGEPLANAATYAVLRQLNWEFPDSALCLSTNGLLLRDRLEQIVAGGVRSVAITVNAFSFDTAKKVYSSILYKGRRYAIEDAAEFLLKKQWQGLLLAAEAGIHVTVNTVLIPGVNEDDIPLIAGKAGKLGAKLMNILPVDPGAEFKDIIPPDTRTLASMRDKCRPFISQVVGLPPSFGA